MNTKEDYIKYRVTKSQEAYKDAQLLMSNGRWNSSVNRLYYSCFYLVSALLYKHAIKADTHNGVKTQFFLHFVKSEIISKEFGKLYSTLLDWRQESDYVDFIEFDEETVNPIINEVADFNTTLIQLISK